MQRHRQARSARLASSLVCVASLSGGAALALPAHNLPNIARLGVDCGRVAGDVQQTLTVALKVPDAAALEATIDRLYDPASASYHQWLSDADLERYAPTVGDFEMVRAELQAHGLTIVAADPHRYTLRVRGSAAAVEKAFQTELHQFSYEDHLYQAHTTEAQLTGAAGARVDGVAGLERHAVRPLLRAQALRHDSAAALPGEITGVALSPAAVYTFTTPGALLPVASYRGTVYDTDPGLTVSFTPAQLARHYGLTKLYADGYDGSGETIALVEAYGYASARKDANDAARVFGLPTLTAANFSVIYPEGKPADPGAADQSGWTVEIALDIQSAHAIAPGAKLLVVAAPGPDNEDLIAAIQYVITNRLAHVVSNSWGSDAEILAGAAEENAFNAVLRQGSAAGISIQFASGDDGDGGLGTPVGAVGVPANSPYATAVGGTSLLNDPHGNEDVVTGWGNNAVILAAGGPLDPPTSAGQFLGGAGGGESLYYRKPAWQKGLPGNGRQVPDVAALADPYTGFAIVYTSGGVQYAEGGWGGTSLSSPIFTAIWAIADQYNGAALGQAGPALAHLKPGQITDVVPASPLTAYDVSGLVIDADGAAFYSPTALFAPLLYATTTFPSAIWNLGGGEAAAISFGTDSSLTVTTGWDNVTGFGEPNGLPFIQGVTGRRTGAAVRR